MCLVKSRVGTSRLFSHADLGSRRHCRSCFMVVGGLLAYLLSMLCMQRNRICRQKPFQSSLKEYVEPGTLPESRYFIYLSYLK